MHVDWKDIDSAVTFGQSLIRENGLQNTDKQEADIQECNSISEYFKKLDQWL